MSIMETKLLQAASEGVFRSLDVQFALMVAQNRDPVLLLAAALVSRHAGEGHVCLPLQTVTAHSIAVRRPETGQVLLDECGLAPLAWPEVLLASGACSTDQHKMPLILKHDRLYLNRLWHYEQRVGQFFLQTSDAPIPEMTNIRTILNTLFAPQHDIDWQKVAVAVALTRKIAVISGGPGTGKTTTVAKLLAALVQLQSDQRLRIRLVAPTGKAAARLTESLDRALSRLNLASQYRERLPDEASTLHRLLGVQPDTLRPHYHASNPLHLDLLVVDEASMVDLPMMARLIDALPPHARVIFLGDRDQLASVEAGAVLGDICHYASAGYSQARASELSALVDYSIPAGTDDETAVLRAGLCLLRKSYRFSDASGIGQLARAVNAGDIPALAVVLDHEFPDIHYHPFNQESDYQVLLDDVVAGLTDYLELLNKTVSPEDVLQAFSHYQLLCALREGPFGVSGLNKRIAALLMSRGIIERPIAGQRWYHGRPIIISRNDNALGLFNGDIGIALRTKEGLRVFFLLTDGTIKSVPPGRLPKHETVWAMTVHKSQGSEFDHTALVLPRHHTPLITRELVYTAITRARRQLSLYAGHHALNQAIATRTTRHSGLTEMLAGIV